MFKDIELPEWHAYASCVQQGIGPDIFYPSKLESQHTRLKLEKLCGGCAVKVACLQAGLDQDPHDGWHGGCSPREKGHILDLGITAAEYLEGRSSGVYVVGPRGRRAG